MKNEIKFKYSFDYFDHALCFDLAQYETGVALINIKNNKIEYIKQISVEDKDICPMSIIYDKFNDIWNDIKNIIDVEKMFIVKEQCPQGSRFSTIKTLQSLARVHGVVDLWIAHKGLKVYSYDGIHASSIKAALKRLIGADKPTKEQIKEYIFNNLNHNFKWDDVTLDISDSIAVFLCLKESKWNIDILEEMKNVKKKIKELKKEKAKMEKQKELSRLENLLIKKEEN